MFLESPYSSASFTPKSHYDHSSWHTERLLPEVCLLQINVHNLSCLGYFPASFIYSRCLVMSYEYTYWSVSDGVAIIAFFYSDHLNFEISIH